MRGGRRSPSPSRVAAFISQDASGDLLRLAAAHDIELVLVDAPPDIDVHGSLTSLTAILERLPLMSGSSSARPSSVIEGRGLRTLRGW